MVAFLCLNPRLSMRSKGIPPAGRPARCRPWQGRGRLDAISTEAFGRPWTRCATRTSWRSFGAAVDPLGEFGNDRPSVFDRVEHRVTTGHSITIDSPVVLC